MSIVNLSEKSYSESVGTRLKSYYELIKFRLSAVVTFSAVFGFILGDSGATFSWNSFFGLMLGGFLISGASCAANEIWERDLDKLMKRTRNRPLPTDSISLVEAYWFAFILAIIGVSLLWIFTNPLTTWLGVLSMVLYAFVYTPLKRVGPIAVFVGAIPGALPRLLSR